MKMPWDVPSKPLRPELVKDPVTGLYPGQIDADDIPGFLKRVREESSKPEPVQERRAWPIRDI
jgi:hypothetical protein